MLFGNTAIGRIDEALEAVRDATPIRQRALGCRESVGLCPGDGQSASEEGE